MGSGAIAWQEDTVSFVLIPTEVLDPAQWAMALVVLFECWQARWEAFWGVSFSIVSRSGSENGSGRMKDSGRPLVESRHISADLGSLTVASNLSTPFSLLT